MYINLILRKKTIFKGVIENMSKMRMPEMSVVRFAESDVICASVRDLPRSVTFNNFNDNEPGNGTVTYDGITYGWKTSEGQANIFDSILYGSGVMIENAKGKPTNFDALVSNEGSSGWGSEDGVANGSYTWDSRWAYSRDQ